MEYIIKVDATDHAFHERQKMNKFRNEGRFCDFTIKLGTKELRVHQNVISSHSDYFDKMLIHDTQEKQNRVVELKGVDQDCAIKCVDFMYTGETSIVEDKCVALMHVATMFQLTPLCDAIVDLLVRNLDSKSFFATKMLADRFENSKLVEICREYALKHFQEIIQLEEFGDLDGEYIKFLLESETKTSEGAKCKSLIKWVKCNSSSRKTSLPGLLSLLELTKVPLSYRSYLTECEPLVNSCSECMKIITMSVFRGMNVKSKDLPEKGSENGICVFDQTSKSLQVLNIGDGIWTSKQEFDTSIMGNIFSSVALNEQLYVFGQNKSVHRISLNDPCAQWERKASKTSCYGDAIALNGFIYTSDYYNKNQRLERYSPDTDVWDFLPNKQMNVYGAPLAISEGKIFCIGGYDRNYCNRVEVYDPATSKWQFDNPMKNARYQSSATTYNDGIYVMGGSSSTGVMQSVEYRCPSTKSWNTLIPMNSPRAMFGSCCIGGEIYAVGGDQNNPQTIEHYDPERKDWRVLNRMTGKNIMSLASISIPM